MELRDRNVRAWFADRGLTVPTRDQIATTDGSSLYDLAHKLIKLDTEQLAPWDRIDRVYRGRVVSPLLRYLWLFGWRRPDYVDAALDILHELCTDHASQIDAERGDTRWRRWPSTAWELRDTATDIWQPYHDSEGRQAPHHERRQSDAAATVLTELHDLGRLDLSQVAEQLPAETVAATVEELTDALDGHTDRVPTAPHAVKVRLTSFPTIALAAAYDGVCITGRCVLVDLPVTPSWATGELAVRLPSSADPGQLSLAVKLWAEADPGAIYTDFAEALATAQHLG